MTIRAGTYSFVDAATFYFFHWHAIWCCVVAFVIAVVCWSIPLYFFICWRREVCSIFYFSFIVIIIIIIISFPFYFSFNSHHSHSHSNPSRKPIRKHFEWLKWQNLKRQQLK